MRYEVVVRLSGSGIVRKGHLVREGDVTLLRQRLGGRKGELRNVNRGKVGRKWAGGGIKN